MSAIKVDQPGKRSEKKFLFSDADQHTIPAVQGWNEGYSRASKFLYVQEAISQKMGRINKN